jgi:hypothetical protein
MPTHQQHPLQESNSSNGSHQAPVHADNPAAKCPFISMPKGFQFQPQDERLKRSSAHAKGRKLTADPPTTPLPPLGVLSNFVGTFEGTGFNTIFRPNNSTNANTTFPIPVTPAPPAVPNDAVLELNLTEETLAFGTQIGSVPNRGFGTQADVLLNGVPYTQTVNDVSNPITGKGDAVPSAIHFEPGLWMHVPATTVDPVVPESLNRMGSIPHGTTINAQTSQIITVAGGPKISAVDITPTIVATGNKVTFASQTVTNTDTSRLPQDLTPFINAGTITQAILTDPGTVLRNAIVGQNIIQTIVFTVSTVPPSPEVGGGTANNAFLVGATTGAATGPNANATVMTSTFWIETVQYELEVPAWKQGDGPLFLKPPVPTGNTSGTPLPVFEVVPPKEITSPTTITVTAPQIQYQQIVNLAFNGLNWPHSSHATLVPQAPVVVDPSAFSSKTSNGTSNGSANGTTNGAAHVVSTHAALRR